MIRLSYLFLVIVIISNTVTKGGMIDNVNKSLKKFAKLDKIPPTLDPNIIYISEACIYTGQDIIKAENFEILGSLWPATYENKIEILLDKRLSSCISLFDLSPLTKQLLSLYGEKNTPLKQKALAVSDTEKINFLKEHTASLPYPLQVKMVKLFVSYRQGHTDQVDMVAMVKDIYDKWPQHTIESTYLFFAVPLLLSLFEQAAYEKMVGNPRSLYTHIFQHTHTILPLKMAGAIVQKEKNEKWSTIDKKVHLLLGYLSDADCILSSLPPELLSMIFYFLPSYPSLNVDDSLTMYDFIQSIVKETAVKKA